MSKQFETVEFVGYGEIEYEPYMILRLDGVEVKIFADLRPGRKFVWLGGEFDVQVEQEGTILRGCTDDDRVMRLYDEFMSKIVLG